MFIMKNLLLCSADATTKAPEYVYKDYDPKALEKKGQR